MEISKIETFIDHCNWPDKSLLIDALYELQPVDRFGKIQVGSISNTASMAFGKGVARPPLYRTVFFDGEFLKFSLFIVLN
jgi:hypothetical protein